MSSQGAQQPAITGTKPAGVKYYYVLYLTYKGYKDIKLREFDTKEEALAFKEKCDAEFKKRGQYRFSKVMKRDMSKHATEYWL